MCAMGDVSSKVLYLNEFLVDCIGTFVGGGRREVGWNMYGSFGVGRATNGFGNVGTSAIVASCCCCCCRDTLV